MDINEEYLDPLSEAAVDAVEELLTQYGDRREQYVLFRTLTENLYPGIVDRTLLSTGNSASLLHGFANAKLAKGYIGKTQRELTECLLRLAESNVAILKKTLELPETVDGAQAEKHN